MVESLFGDEQTATAHMHLFFLTLFSILKSFEENFYCICFSKQFQIVTKNYNVYSQNHASPSLQMQHIQIGNNKNRVFCIKKFKILILIQFHN